MWITFWTTTEEQFKLHSMQLSTPYNNKSYVYIYARLNYNAIFFIKKVYDRNITV